MSDVEPLPVDQEWMVDTLVELLRTPSPAGRTDAVMQLVGDRLVDSGVPFTLTRRGALVAELPGRSHDPDRAVVAHADTLGCQVREIKASGRLAVAPIGHHSSRFAEGARVTVFADDVGAAYTGTILPLKASGHAFGDEVDTQPVGWDHVEVRIDERVEDADDVRRLGVEVGDVVAFFAFPAVTGSGYVVSRHLDGKAGVAAALAAFRAVVVAGVELPRTAHLLVTIAEEVGQGATHGLDRDVAEMVSIDNGVVAPGQQSREDTVTVAMGDMTGPFDPHLSRRLARLAAEAGIPHRRDVFRYYRSDVATAVEAGTETRAALLGYGVDASHGHERTHVESVEGVARLLTAYLQTDLVFEAWDPKPGWLRDFPSSEQPAEENDPTVR